MSLFLDFVLIFIGFALGVVVTAALYAFTREDAHPDHCLCDECEENYYDGIV